MLPAHLQAVDTSLPSACFLIRVFGCFLFLGFFFKMQIKAAPRMLLPGGLAPCVSSSFPPPKKGRAVFGLQHRDRSRGMSLRC